MSRYAILWVTFGATSLAPLLPGCGRTGPDYGSLNLSSASGKVTLGGEPLSEALVLFEAGDRTFSYALTDGKGRYELMFNSEKSGVTKGAKTVRIWSSRGIPGMAEAGGGSEKGPPEAKSPKIEKVPARYNAKSELTVTVDEDSEEFDFDLETR
jgi:hypothetical protein